MLKVAHINHTVCMRTFSAALQRVLPRSMPVMALHSLKAARAASTARDTSFGPDDGTRANTIPDLQNLMSC